MKTIKTIDSYSDNNESVLSTSCGNQTKLIEKMMINKNYNDYIFNSRKDNFKRYNKCKRFTLFKFIK